MRIGFDLDGTVADLRNRLALEALRLFPDVDLSAIPQSAPTESPLAPTEGDVTAEKARPETAIPTSGRAKSIRALSPRQQDQIWKTVCDHENFWESLEEIEPGSLARLYRMVQERRWEVIFLTSRPDTRGDSVQTQTHRWLVAKGYETPSAFVVHSSRGKIAAALELDIVVDDRPENCVDVAVDSTARPILIWRRDQGTPAAGARQLGIGTVESIGECLDLLDTLHRDATKGGLFERLKRLLGLKPSARETESANAPLATAASREA